MRISLGRLSMLVAVFAAPTGMLVAAPAARAETWNVDCSVPDLVSAVAAAQSASAVTINLAPGCTYTFTAASGTTVGGANALAFDTNDATITINGNGATLARSTAAATPNFRLFAVGTADPGQDVVTVDDLTMENGVATGNAKGVAGTYGGAMEMLGSTLTLDGDTFVNNSANGPGGAVEAIAAVTVSDSTFLDNSTGHATANSTGGGLDLASLVSVTGSTFSGNSAVDGGGVSIAGTRGSHDGFTDDTIVGNHASTGGGGISVGMNDDPVALDNDTIAGNTSPSSGGTAINGIAAMTTVTASIIDGTCNPGPGVAGLESGGYDVIPDGSCAIFSGAQATDVTDVSSAGLGPLASNGGPTETEAIGEGSAAFELVPAADCAATDQRGVARPQPSGAGFCDAGAYEAQAVPTVTSYTGPTSGVEGTPVTLSATLAQPQTAVGLTLPAGGGIAGQQLTISLGAESCGATTNAIGDASCQVTPRDAPAAGPYPVSVAFAGGSDGVGGDYYTASSASGGPFTVASAPAPTGSTSVSPAPTGSTSVSPASTGSTSGSPARTSLRAKPAAVAGLEVRMVVAKTGRPLARQRLVFKAGHRRICAARSSARGIATCGGLRALARAVMNLGYKVTYVGTANHGHAAAKGSARRLALRVLNQRGTSRRSRKLTAAALERRLHRLGLAALERRLRALRHRR